MTRQTDIRGSQTAANHPRTLAHHGQTNAVRLRIITDHRQTAPLLSQTTAHAFETVRHIILANGHHPQITPHNPQTKTHILQTIPTPTKSPPTVSKLVLTSSES